MAYCCVPRCFSDAKRKEQGVSFHEIPSDDELRAKWLKLIARKDWVPNTTSRYSVVCSKHFTPADYKEGCKTRKLKRGATPSVFDNYPEYMQPPAKRARSDASVRKREAAVVCPTPASSKDIASSLHHGADTNTPALDASTPGSVSRDGVQALWGSCEHQVDPGPFSAATTQDEGIQVDVRSTVSVVERQKWRRKERDLKTQVERLKQTVDKYKQELRQLKEVCHLTAFASVVEAASEKHLGASILLDQVKNFSAARPTWSEVTVRHCIILRNLSTRAYEHIRNEGILRLPSRATLQRYLGVNTGEVGFTSLVQQRLQVEVMSLKAEQAKVCSL